MARDDGPRVNSVMYQSLSLGLGKKIEEIVRDARGAMKPATRAGWLAQNYSNIGCSSIHQANSSLHGG